MKKVIVVIEHHSGTDDKIWVYDYHENTIEYLQEEIKRYYDCGSQCNYEGDWDWGYDDSWHTYYVVREVMQD